MRLLLLFITSLLLCHHANAQASGELSAEWSLERCVAYAIDHNISIKQNELNKELSRYTLKQSQYSQLPTFSANSSYGRSFGRSINPATNQFVDAGYNFLNASGNANLLVFGWMQVRNTIERNKFALQAAIADLDQLRDNVSLNVANGFLAALLAKEQVTVSSNQVAVSKAQLTQTRAFAEAGRLPELNVAQLESQLASDSANLISSIANYNAALLDLKTLLNLDFSVPFNIQVPDVEVSDILSLSAQQPEGIYQSARQHLGSIRSSQLRVKAAEKGLAASKGNLYPQLSGGYQLGTTFASNYKSYQMTNRVLAYSPLIVDTASQSTIYTPNYETLTSDVPFGTQLANNYRQSVFVNLSIPILNSWQAQYGVRQARINLATEQLNEYNAELTLKQSVYKAHNNAVNAVQKYNAAKRAHEAAKRALDFATKRYDLGLTSTVDLLVTQNSALAAASNLVSAKYDLIFKLKVVDYYLGKPLKL
jgi:outer membrane protein